MVIFKPKTFLDLCMAMKTRAEVEFDNTSTTGFITNIKHKEGLGWDITINPSPLGHRSDELTILFYE